MDYIARFGSVGYGASKYIKPDVVAPGVWTVNVV